MVRHTWLVGGLVAALLGGAVTAEEGPPKKEPAASLPLGEVYEGVSAEGKPYWYRLPKKLARGEPVNLLIMLHGTGLKWGWAFWNYPIANGSFRGDDIVVAPEGMTPGGNDTFNFVQGKADGEHIAGLIRLFKSRFDIGHVAIYGHSQGAFFCYWFAGEYPELVDGIVAHAGNVLDVKHPDVAVQNLAVGILHARADAVVPVECATRTEQIYREKGYRKLKLMIVEGLDRQSGHWPLPQQVAEMLEWVDQVSVKTLRGALDVAFHELSREQPDLAAIASPLAQARALEKRTPAKERESCAPRLAALTGLLEQAQGAHIASIADATAKEQAKTPYGAWAAHFRLAQRAFDGQADWDKAMKTLRAKARSHSKTVAKAIELAGTSNPKAFPPAVGALADGYLGEGYDDLALALVKMADTQASALRPADVAAFRELAQARATPEADGRARFAELSAELLAAFKNDHLEWIPRAGD